MEKVEKILSLEEYITEFRSDIVKDYEKYIKQIKQDYQSNSYFNSLVGKYFKIGDKEDYFVVHITENVLEKIVNNDDYCVISDRIFTRIRAIFVDKSDGIFSIIQREDYLMDIEDLMDNSVYLSEITESEYGKLKTIINNLKKELQ